MAKKKHPVKAYERRPPTRKPPQAPMPGQHEFDPDQERAMRQGQRQANTVPAAEMAGMEDDVGL